MKKSLLLLFVLLSAIGLRAQDATVVADTLKADVTTTLEVGKTYVIGESYAMCKVSFTAPTDGMLTITTSQRINRTSLKINGAGSTFSNENGGFTKKGMAAGSVFEGTFYAGGTPSADNTYALTVTFEEGTPYEPLTMTEAHPANGSEWSGAAIYYTTYATYKGQAYYDFSSAVNTKEMVASIKIGEKVYSPITLYAAKNGVTLKTMPDTLSAAIAAGLIKAGETFTVTLSNIQDKEFAANTLKDTTFTYTLASTACTGVNPVASTSRTELPTEVVFSFDGEVKIDTAKFYFVNKKTGEQTELTGATVDGTSLTIPVPAIEGLLPKAYDVIAVGVTDANGKTITYGETAGQLTVAYGTKNGYFQAVASPANYDKVSSLKTYTFTLPGDLVFDNSQAYDTISFGKLNEATYSFEAIEGLTVSYEINANVLTVTLSEEITAPGDYRLSIPSKTFWAKDLYDAENLSETECYYMPSQNITCTILPFGPTTVTPATGSMLNKIEDILLSFDEPVEFADTAKVIVSMYKEVDNDWGFTDFIPVAIAECNLDYDYTNDNNLIVKVGCIDSMGMYTVEIPEGSIWTVADETKKVGKWTYEYSVDPDYWNPEWVVIVGDSCTQEAPCQLIAGRKYEFSAMCTYAQFKAEETGRVYLTNINDKWSETSAHAADWMRIGDLNETEDGRMWFGVKAGESYNLQNYGFGKRQFLVEFEAGSPYDAISYIGSSPVSGNLYSKSTQAEYSYSKGYVDFVFSHRLNADSLQIFVVLPGKDNKEIDVTADVYVEIGGVYGVGAYAGLDMRDAIETLKSTEGLKAGDKFQIVLKNMQDASFAENKWNEEVKVELTLAATVCTSVYPNCEWGGVDAIPGEIELRFDGNVTCATGKGFIIDVKSGTKQEFALDSLACTETKNWDGSILYDMVVTLPEPTIELTSKQFAVQLEGLVDAEGNVVSYGNEVGKFIIDYYFRDDCLNYVSVDPEAETNVTSIKTTKLTFAEEVHLSPSEDIEAPTIYVGENVVTGTMAIDPTDPKSVIITWSEEITKPGRYGISIAKASIYDSKFDASKEDYGVADGASYNPYYDITYYIAADLSATTVANITPAPSIGWMPTPVSQLPAEVTIEFEGNVKEVLYAYGEVGGMWSAESDSAASNIPEGATALTTRIEDNKVIVSIPEEVISAVTMGKFIITVKALGEDGKAISYAFDNWGDQDMYAEIISFPYTVEKTLELVEASPAEGTVKQLDQVVLTFNDAIFEVDTYSTAEVYDENFEEVAEATVTFEGSVATLTFNNAVTTAGNYILNIPQDMFATEAYVTNTELRINYTVDPNYTGEPVVEDLAIVSATPENGATVANLTTVEFKLNKEVGYLHNSMLMPADGGDDAGYAALTQSEADPAVYTLDFALLSEEGVTLRKDVSYTITLDAYASEDAYNRDGEHETVTLTYVGAAEAYQYSDVTFEGITPAEDFVISDSTQNQFVVKFSGAVNLVEELTCINLGQGATEKFESIVANDAKTEYTLTIAKSLLNTLRNEVILIVAANDESGKRVQGNNGEEEFSTIVATYKTTIGVPDLTVTPDAAVEQASLSTLTIQCAEGLVPSWTAGNITLTDANGNAIALNDPEAVEAEGANESTNEGEEQFPDFVERPTPTAWTVALSEELKTIGTYTLTIPAGYFNIGNVQGQVMNSKETVVVFNITEKAQGIKGITVDAEVVVYNVAGVVVANGKASEVLKSLGKGIYIVNGKKYVVK